MCEKRNMITHLGKCINHCPHNFIRSEENQCLNCENITGKCEKPCKINVIIKSEMDAKILRKCNQIDGSITIELRRSDCKL